MNVYRLWGGHLVEGSGQPGMQRLLQHIGAVPTV